MSEIVNVDALLATTAGDVGQQPIILNQMGSFFFAGRVARAVDGETFHGDHGYAQYFVPEPARDLPLVMWHGLGQSGKCWESTPDGREGFWQLFLRRNWPVYIIDQPRRGRAGRAMPADDAEPLIPTMEAESEAWATFRLGRWKPPGAASFFDGLRMARDQASIEQLMRQQTPGTGVEPFPDAGHREFLGGAVAELVASIGPSVLMTHSHSGQYGWVTAVRQPKLVRAVVAIEPGEYAFPHDGVPEDVSTDSDLLREFMAPQVIPAADFAALTRIPILVMFGDFIADEPDEAFGVELWRVVRERAKQFVATVNARGGDATLLELRDCGLPGNTHFPMADLDNVEFATLIENFLLERGLGASGPPHHCPHAR
ncbi:alpha/beta fold hydrolase [Nocardia sp. CA2R105]|uniref:alpha/beta hydrolase n=1 Tax=Nocardia coffeae TaxID=2873381 RepID=UPI001CA6FF57|nr:alpha/beta fold hydrolase [Nocardia coffeae]MBY8858692.1 alpha/beta fold hydrolase [Nocardia coffeae]